MAPSWRYANEATRDVDEFGSNFSPSGNHEPIALIFVGNHEPRMVRSKVPENNLALTIKNEAADYLFIKRVQGKIAPDQEMDIDGFKTTTLQLSECFSDLSMIKGEPLTVFTERMKQADRPIEGAAYGLTDAIFRKQAVTYVASSPVSAAIKRDVAGGKLSTLAEYFNQHPEEGQIYRAATEGQMDDFVGSLLKQLN